MIVNKSHREKIFCVVACVVIGLLLVSCTRRESVSQVAVLGSPAYAVTSEIAAEGEIVNATPLGSDPHYMEFTSSVARVLEQSKAVIALGASADRKMVSELSKPKLFLLPEGLEDPHVWLSPKGSWHGCHKYNPFWMSSSLIQKMYMHKTLKSSWLPTRA